MALMKRAASLVAASVALCAFASSANAQDTRSGFYFGAFGGQSTYDVSQEELDEVFIFAFESEIGVEGHVAVLAVERAVTQSRSATMQVAAEPTGPSRVRERRAEGDERGIGRESLLEDHGGVRVAKLEREQS